MKTYIPTPLRAYTQGRDRVEADGATLAELFVELDRVFPGIRFRIIDEQDQIREHIKVFVDQEIAADLTFPLQGHESVCIIMAISGGEDQEGRPLEKRPSIKATCCFRCPKCNRYALRGSVAGHCG